MAIIMKLLVIFSLFLALSLVFAKKDDVDLKRLLARAQEQIERQVLDRAVKGAQSSRFSRKKVTNLSRALSMRNSLYRKALSVLESDGFGGKEAKEIVDRAMEAHRGGKQRGPGGQSGKTDPITLAEDLCNNPEPECDSEAKFRTLDGRCNNLHSERTLWGSMSIKMRRYLPSIPKLYQVPTFTSVVSQRALDLLDGKSGEKHCAIFYDIKSAS